jgi:D-alanyl-D-alanine carboxypeptidase (penicillin-binding protein 5/6)
MLTRRLALLASLALGAGRAWAQPQGAKKPATSRPAKPGHAEPAPTGSPANTPLGPVDTTARWGVIIDYATGATMLDKDADLEIPPSSMTKLMTAYIVYSRLADGRLKLTDMLPVSEKAWRMGG